MRMWLRRLWNVVFTQLSVLSVAVMAAAVLVILVPIFWRGSQAVLFDGTVEWRLMQLKRYGRGDPNAIQAQLAKARDVREEAWQMLDEFSENPAVIVHLARVVDDRFDALRILVGVRVDVHGDVENRARLFCLRDSVLERNEDVETADEHRVEVLFGSGQLAQELGNLQVDVLLQDIAADSTRIASAMSGINGDRVEGRQFGRPRGTEDEVEDRSHGRGNQDDDGDDSALGHGRRVHEALSGAQDTRPEASRIVRLQLRWLPKEVV